MKEEESGTQKEEGGQVAVVIPVYHYVSKCSKQYIIGSLRSPVRSYLFTLYMVILIDCSGSATHSVYRV